MDIRNVSNLDTLLQYFSENLSWELSTEDIKNIDDVSYDFDARDIGLKDEEFAKISSLKQLRPLVKNQEWGIFAVEFDSERFEISALRKILSKLIPNRRNSIDRTVWQQKNILFLCFWGTGSNRTIGIVHFEEKEKGLPVIKIIYCSPAIEDSINIRSFEASLQGLSWPKDIIDTEKWHGQWSAAFSKGYKEVINDSKTLTKELAKAALNIKKQILDIYKVETPFGYVHLLHKKFKDTLIHDLNEYKFADMYAQTVVYGLFSARCMDDTKEDFSAEEAVECIPITNPFLKNLMRDCLGTANGSGLTFDELDVGSVVDLLLHANTASIIADFNRQTGGGKEDPVIHFYEEFLAEYDNTQKVQRGVYYTPQPVVNFIVKAVDDIIKFDFGYKDGLATTETKTIKVQRESKQKRDGLYRMVTDTEQVSAIQILDPATGTGTFLRQTILQIYSNFKETHKGKSETEINELWNKYVPNYLLPRLNAFELMMAPYAVAHMKLAMVLKDTGYDFRSNERLNVLLTNSLEEPGDSSDQLSFEALQDPLAMESIEANKIKKNQGINIIIGNPPYSGISSNSGLWITNMIEDYKYINGVHFNERKHWLQDDYVKFIRLCENVLENKDDGILAFVNNHAFIDNPTFRCMRWHLLQSFSEIYIVNLHGNVMKKEINPAGEKDENVFDIQQGVSINIFVKSSGKKTGNCKVYYADLFGKREKKYDFLNKASLKNMDWEVLNPKEPFFFFIPRNEEYIDEYESGFSMNDLMPVHCTGIVTARDSLVIDSSYDTLLKRIEMFANEKYDDDYIRKYFFGDKKSSKYLPGDSRGWSLVDARKKIRTNNHKEIIKKIEYRPFDVRYIYYSSDIVDWGRESTLINMIRGDNYGLIIPRQAATDNWSHVQITKYMADNRIHYSNKGIPIQCPLYLYSPSIDGKFERVPNINVDIANGIAEMIGMEYLPLSNCDSYINELDILDYVYAVLFSNKYRQKYLSFLKFDFPKIPYPKSKNEFYELAKLGTKLRILHTNEISIEAHCDFCGKENPIIENPYFKDGNVFFNKEDYISNVPKDIWEMYFGGYQPLQKWLKDRKKLVMTKDDICTYMRIVEILKETKETMQKIDLIINL